MIRRMKSQVLKNLPGKDRIVEYVLPDPVYVPELKRMQSRMSAIDRAMKDCSGDSDAIKGKELAHSIVVLFAVRCRSACLTHLTHPHTLSSSSSSTSTSLSFSSPSH
jgi:hypothetical protein